MFADCVLVVDRDWRVVSFNRQAAGLLAGAAADLAGRDFWNLAPSLRDTPAEVRLREAMDRRTPTHLVLNHSGRDVQVYACPSDDGLAVLGYDVTRHSLVERELAETAAQLKERVKELTCLYEVSAACNQSRRPLRAILSDVVAALPPAMQYPEGTKGIVRVGRLEVRAQAHLAEGPPLARPVMVDDEIVGEVCVTYAPGTVLPGLPSFLPQEGALLDVIARQLGQLVARRRAAAEARIARRGAERAASAKARFLAAASHDLRQPLQAAALFAAAMGAEDGLSPRLRTMVDRIDTALGSVNELIGNLLDLSRLDSGALRPDTGELSVADLLERVAIECLPAAEAKGIELRLVPCRATIISDASMLAQILRNLVGNAVRYTDKGRVLIGCRRNGAGLRCIEVWDTGVGITGDQISRIFEEFYQADGTRAGRAGVGLGLAIARQLARALEHRITVRSWPGRGSVFTVWLES